MIYMNIVGSVIIGRGRERGGDIINMVFIYEIFKKVNKVKGIRVWEFFLNLGYLCILVWF